MMNEAVSHLIRDLCAETNIDDFIFIGRDQTTESIGVNVRIGNEADLSDTRYLNMIMVIEQFLSDIRAQHVDLLKVKDECIFCGKTVTGTHACKGVK